MDKMERLTNTAVKLVKGAGAFAAGVVNLETLAGGPPSTDLTYVLPNAKSALVFAMPLDDKAIESFLKKEDMAAANRDNRIVNCLASGAALELAEYLRMKGFDSEPVNANAVYRKDVDGGPYSEKPPVSHRYLAVRSGVASFGFSGNVITKEHGATIILGSVVTAAELVPTDPMPEEDNYCDDCKLCLAACASGLMDDTEKTTVTMGGVDFTYAKRRTYSRCDYVCGGFAGLHSSGKWSTWSPARFPIPDNDEDFMPALMNTVDAYKKRPKQEFGCDIIHPLSPGNVLDFTCGHCQFICNPDKTVRQNRYDMLKEGGVTIQLEDGTLKAVSPEEAEKYMTALDDEKRAMYEFV